MEVSVYNGVVGAINTLTSQAVEEPSMTTPSYDYCLIPLTRGQFAKVSPHRFRELSKYSWQAHWDEDSHGYYAVSSQNLGNGKWSARRIHRIILGLSADDRRHGEHINRDSLDNRDENLRIATHTQNQGNRGLQRNNTSGYKGVSWAKRQKKWCAQITKNGRPRHLGLFSDPKEAHAVYLRAAKEYFGEFARAK